MDGSNLSQLKGTGLLTHGAARTNAEDRGPCEVSRQQEDSAVRRHRWEGLGDVEFLATKQMQSARVAKGRGSECLMGAESQFGEPSRSGGEGGDGRTAV